MEVENYRAVLEARKEKCTCDGLARLYKLRDQCDFWVRRSEALESELGTDEEHDTGNHALEKAILGAGEKVHSYSCEFNRELEQLQKKKHIHITINDAYQELPLGNAGQQLVRPLTPGYEVDTLHCSRCKTLIDVL